MRWCSGCAKGHAGAERSARGPCAVLRRQLEKSRLAAQERIYAKEYVAKRKRDSEVVENVQPTTPPPWRQSMNEEPTPCWRPGDDLGVLPNDGHIDRFSAMADA